MAGFTLKTPDGQTIRFNCYHDTAPLTSSAFIKLLPFTRTFLHARISGQEIWIDNAPELDINQENASIHTEPGEIVFGPVNPSRNKIGKCLGIFYGEGKLLDCGNIFGKVWEEDMPKLIALGDRIWRHGALELTFEKANEEL